MKKIVIVLAVVLLVGCEAPPDATRVKCDELEILLRQSIEQTDIAIEAGNSLAESAKRWEAEFLKAKEENITYEATINHLNINDKQVCNVWRRGEGEIDSEWEFCYIARSDGSLRENKRYIGKPMVGCQEQVREPTPERFDKFVLLNARQHKIIGETLISFHQRLQKLEQPNETDPNKPE